MTNSTTITATWKITDAGVTTTVEDTLAGILCAYRVGGYLPGTRLLVRGDGPDYYLDVYGERVPRAQISREADITLQKLPGKYRVVDTNGSSVTEHLSSADEADALEDAEEWLRDGGWDTSNGTVFVTARVDVAAPGEESGWNEIREIELALNPAEPKCAPGREHEWDERSVVGHGGGVIIEDACTACGAVRTTDTWAQGPNGKQGYRSVSYAAAAK